MEQLLQIIFYCLGWVCVGIVSTFALFSLTVYKANKGQVSPVLMTNSLSLIFLGLAIYLFYLSAMF
jgi:hypothetical protein